MSWSELEVIDIEIPLKALIDFFIEEIKKTSILTLIVGAKGSGKSLLAGKLCECIDKKFNKEQQIVSRIEDLNACIERQVSDLTREYGVLNLDDFGSELDAMEFSSEIAKKASHLYQKDRLFNIGSFLTVPDANMINKTFRERLTSYKIEVLGHNTATGVTRIKLFSLHPNRTTGEVYNHRLHYEPATKKITKKKTDTSIPLGVLKIKKPSKEFIEWYEPFRRKLGLDELRKKILEKPDIRKLDRKDKNKEEITEYARLIVLAGDKYTKSFRGKKLIDKDLIGADFGLGDRTVSKVAAILKQNGYIQ